MSENINEKLILKNKIEKVSTTFLKKHLKIYNNKSPEINNLSLYVIFNPLLQSKPGEIILTYTVEDQFVECYLVSEFIDFAQTEDMIIYSKKLKNKLFIEFGNKIILDKRAFLNAQFIEKIENENDIIVFKNSLDIIGYKEKPDKYIESFRKNEFEKSIFISPFNHLQEYILEKYIINEVYEYWNIYDNLLNIAHASVNSKHTGIEKELINLKNSKEIIFKSGDVVLLTIKDNFIFAKKVKGKTKIQYNNITIINKSKKLDSKEKLKIGICIKSNKEKIIVKSKLS